ncbi:MAG TPA: cupin domain-containing protein [Solirubrobacteraceae bacterium]|jgi:quercetin dioxygenase-like cupin family protein|nr:cupin domain-containing protein [Solirubrobacteraceae bacterium]
MQIKRVVTAVDEQGRSVVQEEGELELVEPELFAGYGMWLVWGTEGALQMPAPIGTEPALRPFFPGPGGTRFGVFSLPPEPRDAPPAGPPDEESLQRTVAEAEELLPGMLSVFEPDHPGMHTTPTIDYDIVIKGTLTLELDDGVEVELPPGTAIVQNGTRHAWHNYGAETAIMAYVIVDARA